jgi:hypothetical protein
VTQSPIPDGSMGFFLLTGPSHYCFYDQGAVLPQRRILRAKGRFLRYLLGTKIGRNILDEEAVGEDWMEGGKGR